MNRVATVEPKGTGIAKGGVSRSGSGEAGGAESFAGVLGAVKAPASGDGGGGGEKSVREPTQAAPAPTRSPAAETREVAGSDQDANRREGPQAAAETSSEVASANDTGSQAEDDADEASADAAQLLALLGLSPAPEGPVESVEAVGVAPAGDAAGSVASQGGQPQADSLVPPANAQPATGAQPAAIAQIDLAALAQAAPTVRPPQSPSTQGAGRAEPRKGEPQRLDGVATMPGSLVAAGAAQDSSAPAAADSAGIGNLGADVAVGATAAPTGAAATDFSAALRAAADTGTAPTTPLAAIDGPRGAQASTPAPAPAATAPALQQPVGTAEWGQELGIRLAAMIDRGEQVATLRLTPEELGPVEVRIALREGEASVWFGAGAAETRSALEQAIPRLRELLATGGLALAHAAVQGETPRDPQRALSAANLARLRREAGEGTEDSTAVAVKVRRGLLDLYA